jgi:6-phosphogluconate dehydrogenase
MIGLGKMGGNMAKRLMGAGHRVVGYARRKETVEAFVGDGGEGAYSLAELVGALDGQKVIWTMIPAGDPVDRTIEGVLPFLSEGDIVVDGGNSFYKDTLRRSAALSESRIHYVDVGTSGGIWGLKEGYSMMVGGEEEIVEHLRPLLEALAPAPDKGWGRVGPGGSGHFVKMVHNGIEYGLMEAYAEGFAIMRKKAEFDLDLHQVAEVWRHGSVVRSWLLDLTSRALEEDPGLAEIAPHVEDSGEGRWTVFEAIDSDVAAPVITLSLIKRLRSRDMESFSDRMLAVMRKEFGGHATKEWGG